MITINKIFNKIKFIIWHNINKIQVKKIGHKSIINPPLRIEGKEITIGNFTTVRPKSWLAAKSINKAISPRLKIGNFCCIGNYNEIYATEEIIIEDYVLTADRVYISDNLHGYEDPNVPIIKQPIKQIGTVRIGEGSWLGVGVSVIGANIGKHCVIGANAVVTKDIPDFSVAVGIPAKIIKRYNFETKEWEKTNSDGSFLTH